MSIVSSNPFAQFSKKEQRIAKLQNCSTNISSLYLTTKPTFFLQFFYLSVKFYISCKTVPVYKVTSDNVSEYFSKKLAGEDDGCEDPRRSNFSLESRWENATRSVENN